MSKASLTKSSHLKRFIPLIVLVLLMVIVFSAGLREKLNLEALQTQKDALLEYVTVYPMFSMLGFMGVYILAVALSLPIATVLTLLGGFLFGKVFGTLYVVSAATIGASIYYRWWPDWY